MSEKKTTAVSTRAVDGKALAKELGVTPGQLQTIQNVIAKGATVDELKLFMYQANKMGLDPFSRQIHFVKRKQKDGDSWIEVPAIQTGIDGYRAIAQRTGDYAGSDEPVFDIDEPGKQPTRATVTVHKIVHGQRVGFSATARWAEYFPGEKQGFMWKNKPYIMLGKCAEALALRKAFPADLSGVYVKEELDKPIEIENEPLPPFREIVMTALMFAESMPETKVGALRERMIASNFTDDEKKSVEEVISRRFPTPEPKDEPEVTRETPENQEENPPNDLPY